MGMESFYASLPKTSSKLYIRGYTETLAMYPGVRVIPSEDFLYGVDRDLLDKFFYYFSLSSLKRLSYPCYYIPIKQGRCHYGFILKSSGLKDTPGESWWRGMKLANLDALLDPRPYVFVVEGIKDMYLFLKRGLPTVAMTTATVSATFVEECRKLGKAIVFCGDSDEAGEKNFDPDSDSSLLNRCVKAGVMLVRGIPKYSKDYGEIFDLPPNQTHRIKWIIGDFDDMSTKAVATIEGVES